MRYIVCIKQVMENAAAKINPATHALLNEGAPAIINPFDAYAIEESLRMKAKLGGTVTAITMGPPQAEAVLREAIAMGADEGILLSDPAFAGSDAWATSYILALAIRKIGTCDIIFCGKQASDGETAQVGPGLAAYLDLPQITYVRKIETVDDRHIVAERLLESGSEVIDAPLPCVLTVVKELNEPRLPSLKGKLAAKKAVLTHWQAADLQCDPACIGLDGSPTRVLNVATPPPRAGGEIFKGEPDEIVPQVVAKLKDAVLSARS